MFQPLVTLFPALESGIVQPVPVPDDETGTKNTPVSPAEDVLIAEIATNAAVESYDYHTDGL